MPSTVGRSVAAMHTLVYSPHRSLGDALGGQSPVVATDGCYRLNGEAGVVVGIDLFDDAIDASERLARAGQSDAAMDRSRCAPRIGRWIESIGCRGARASTEPVGEIG